MANWRGRFKKWARYEQIASPFLRKIAGFIPGASAVLDAADSAAKKYTAVESKYGGAFDVAETMRHGAHQDLGGGRMELLEAPEPPRMLDEDVDDDYAERLATRYPRRRGLAALGPRFDLLDEGGD